MCCPLGVLGNLIIYGSFVFTGIWGIRNTLLSAGFFVDPEPAIYIFLDERERETSQEDSDSEDEIRPVPRESKEDKKSV